jgi:hypothetical protein
LKLSALPADTPYSLLVFTPATSWSKQYSSHCSGVKSKSSIIESRKLKLLIDLLAFVISLVKSNSGISSCALFKHCHKVK